MPAPPPRFPDYQSTTEYLYALKSGGVKFGIDRMRELAAALGHPERAYPVVHVAGTNGKGSVSAMLESILRAAGLRTGLYTSPHLVKLGERVQVNRRILSEEEIMRYTEELVPIAGRLGASGPDDHPSFFEFMTAMAFLQFARARADIGVIEVGMGGRLDATNVVQPEVSVITSIGYDHLEHLGATIEAIAREKAGIIKPGRPLVLGRVPPEAEAVIRAVARGHGAPVLSVRAEFGAEAESCPGTNLEGDYQRWNAATAALAARLLQAGFPGVDARAISTGLNRVIWPGRWERITVGGRTIILDASHNPEGAGVLEQNLHRLVATTGRRPVVVTGILGEYRARALLEAIGRHAQAVHVIMPQQARACSHEELERLAGPELKPHMYRASVETVFPAPDLCTVGEAGETVVVTGSLYLVGEILARLRPGLGAGEGRLQDF